MHSADMFLYAAIGLAVVGVAVAAWIGRKQPRLPVPRQVIYVLIWLPIFGLLFAYYWLRSPS